MRENGRHFPLIPNTLQGSFLKFNFCIYLFYGASYIQTEIKTQKEFSPVVESRDSLSLRHVKIVNSEGLGLSD